MMIARDTVRAYKDPASARQPVVAVHPNGEGLARFVAPEIHVHALDGLAVSSSAEQKGS
jgi:hypothetical protein